jgi:hypothetical protein
LDLECLQVLHHDYSALEKSTTKNQLFLTFFHRDRNQQMGVEFSYLFDAELCYVRKRQDGIPPKL